VTLLLLSPASALAALTPSPGSHDWGSVDRHQTSVSQTFSFVNEEGVPVSGVSVALTGPDASEFSTFNDSCSGASLNEWDSCQVSVQLTPQSTGPKSASLDVDDGIGVAGVPLSASAQTGELSVSPDPVGFSPQPWYFGGQFQNVSVQNSSFGTQVTDVSLDGPDAGLFSFGYDNCTNQTLFPFNSCQVGISFNPAGPLAATDAALVIDSDSATGPATTELQAAALFGPDPEIDPGQKNFGAVAVGSSTSAQTFTLTNDGDFPAQIQQLLILSGTPQVFPLTNDTCSQAIVPPAESCSFDLAFAPAQPGNKEAAVFVIANTPAPVTQVGVTGQGHAAPSAAAVVEGKPAVGQELSCAVSNVNGDLAYAWLRDGDPITGAAEAEYVPTNDDFGEPLACEVTATNPVGSSSATSPETPPLGARNLADDPRSFVEHGSCRVASLGAIPGVEVSGTDPATPESPLTLASDDAIDVELGTLQKSGRRVRFDPRDLTELDDGTQALTVDGNASQAVLGPCSLSARVAGSRQDRTIYALSGATGIESGAIRTPDLKLKPHRGIAGQATVFSHGRPEARFPISGRRTAYNGMVVELRRHRVEASGLPTDTATLQIELDRRTVTGTGGDVYAKGTLRGATGEARANVKAFWR